MRTMTNNDLQVTIDLTEIGQTPESDRTLSALAERPFSSRNSDAIARMRAVDAFRVTRRRRRIRSLIDTCADASMALGGVTLLNVGMRARFGLPRGIGGIALGIGLIGAGAAIAMRHRARKHGGDDPATSMHASRNVIVLDEPARVIELEEKVHTAA